MLNGSGERQAGSHRSGGVGRRRTRRTATRSGNIESRLSGARSPGLARSPNHTKETDRTNQTNQLPATRREMVLTSVRSGYVQNISQCLHYVSRFITSSRVCFQLPKKQITKQVLLWMRVSGTKGGRKMKLLST